MNNKEIVRATEDLLTAIYGLNWHVDPNFIGTPERVARSYGEILQYENSEIRNQEIKKCFKSTFPSKNTSKMIFAPNIIAHSMCPHHMLPVSYNLTVAYIPSDTGSVVGASKLERVSRILAARAILQEDLTDEISDTINKELKPLGVAVVVSGIHDCYDDKTEILTDNGWKYFKDLGRFDQVGQINQQTMELSFIIPEEIIKKEYDGKMIQIQNESKKCDLLVTPTHRMLYETEWKYKNHKTFTGVCEAKDLKNTGHLCVIPKTPSKRKNNPKLSTIYGISGDDFCKFMGYYLADGSCSLTNQRKKVRITKTDAYPEQQNLLHKFFTDSGISYLYMEKDQNFIIQGDFLQQIFPLLFEMGKLREKFVPRIIKAASNKQIELFLNAYTEFDGCTYANGKRHWHTLSNNVLDDIQELLLYTGVSGTIQSNEKHMETNRGVVCIRKEDIKEVLYKGMIFCCTVPDGFLMLRRNGKTYVCGNCMRVRGVKSIGSFEVSSMTGSFKENESTRSEFFSLMHLAELRRR